MFDSFVDVANVLLSIFREAWGALVVAIISFVLLALLIQLMRSAGSSVLGAKLWIQESLASGMGLIVLVLFGFVGIPAMVKAVHISVPSCGTVTEIGKFSAMLIGGLVGLRMLKALSIAVFMASVGAPTPITHALIETGGAMFGMIIGIVAVPIAAKFFGAC